MSRRTLAFLAAAVLLGLSFYFFPPSPRDNSYTVRGRFISLFVAVGVFCASWALDERRKSRY
ncbi:MAG: hypothetical protein AB1716_20005 [Planctomycetota bacterium]